MRTRPIRLLLHSAAVALVAFAALPLVSRPWLIAVGALGLAALLLATRSVAIPLAVGGVPTLVIGLLGRDPFPSKSVPLFFFFWTSAAIVLHLLREPGLASRVLFSVPVYLTLALAMFMAIGLIGSPAPEYGSLKLELFLATNLVVLIGGMILARSARDVHLFVLLSLVVAAATSALVLYGLWRGGLKPTLGDSRYSVATEQYPIDLGRQAAQGLVFGFFAIVASSPRPLRVGALLWFPALVVALLAAGSRGPVLALSAGMIFFVLTLVRRRVIGGVLVTATLVTVIAVVLAKAVVPAASTNRALSTLFGGSVGLSDNGRYALWAQAWHAFLENPIHGLGAGGFDFVNSANVYPHNLFLEVASELGLPGLVLVILLLAATFVYVGRMWRLPRGREARDHLMLATALLVMAVVNASLSSDIQKNAGVWLAVGLVYGIGLRERRSVAPVPHRRSTFAPARPEDAAVAWGGRG